MVQGQQGTEQGKMSFTLLAFQLHQVKYKTLPILKIISLTQQVDT